MVAMEEEEEEEEEEEGLFKADAVNRRRRRRRRGLLERQQVTGGGGSGRWERVLNVVATTCVLQRFTHHFLILLNTLSPELRGLLVISCSSGICLGTRAN